MQKRRLFLLFLSAMSVSIIVMVIVYGLFIKDFDFTLDVKNPESAPSPIDTIKPEEYSYPIAEEDTAGDKSPSSVKTPDEDGKATDDKADETAADTADELVPAETEVLPLQPDGAEQSAPLPTGPVPSAAMESPSTLHYVYLDGFSSKESAEQAIQQLQDRSLVAKPYIRQHNGKVILQFGVFSDKANAEVMAQQLRNQSVFVKVE